MSKYKAVRSIRSVNLPGGTGEVTSTAPSPEAQASAEETRSVAYHKQPVESMVGICPYYIKERGHGSLSCECARLRFPDTLARREIVYTFCGHPKGYRVCPFKVAMDHYYERKYTQINEQN